MLVSIVTPSYNQGEFITATLESVQTQTYRNFEHIVMDNCSTEATTEILDNYAQHATVIIEPDNGQTDAINKGMRRAKGDILAWLNADDLYVPHTLQTVVDFFETHPDAMFLYGNVEVVDRSGKSYGIRPFIQPTNAEELIHHRNRIVQPAAFWRAELWEEVGELDTSLTYLMDYEYWMRVARHTKLHYIDTILARERLHNETKTFRGSLARIRELTAIAERHGGSGLPDNFRAEASVTYLLNGHFNEAMALRPPLAKFIKHLVGQTIFRQAEAWLWYTRITGKRTP